MKILAPYRYTEEIIPPRCRKLRRVQFDATMQLTIHEFSMGEIPVAIRQYTKEWIEGHLVATSVNYYWWRNRLWALYKDSRYSRGPILPMKKDEFVKTATALEEYPTTWRSKQESRRSLMQWARSRLLIDGLRYDATGEPRYVIMTFGLGHNHGLGWGTSPSVDNSYNSNIGRARYFRIDEYGKMLVEATRIATARGDTKALPIEEEQNPDRFEVLIPEAIRLQPSREHHDGDPFTNELETVIEGSPDSFIAGLLVVSKAAKLLEGPA